MWSIWKYSLTTDSHQQITMPEGAQILHIGVQYDTMCIWVLLDPQNESVPRQFRVVGTGESIKETDEELRYLSTLITEDGYRIWHIFELIESGVKPF